MLIKVINPNTTWAMTEKIGECARSVAAVGTMIEAVSPSMGPASIESHYDEALSVPGVLDEIAKGERDGVDGYVLACFGDPGLDAARELAGGPVVAIAEAGMKVATYLGRGFTVVTTLDRTIGRAWDLAAHYGVKELVPERPGLRDRRARAGCPGFGGPRCDHRGVCSGGCRGRLRRHRSRLRRDGRPGRRHQCADRRPGRRRGGRGHHDGAVAGGHGPEDQYPLASSRRRSPRTSAGCSRTSR